MRTQNFKKFRFHHLMIVF